MYHLLIYYPNLPLVEHEFIGLRSLQVSSHLLSSGSLVIWSSIKISTAVKLIKFQFCHEKLVRTMNAAPTSGNMFKRFCVFYFAIACSCSTLALSVFHL